MSASASLLQDTLGASALTVTVGGNVIPWGKLAAITIRHGRQSAEDQPDASTCQFSIYADGLPALPNLGQSVSVQIADTARAGLGLARALNLSANLLGSPSFDPTQAPEAGAYGVFPVALQTPGRTGTNAYGATTATTAGQGIVQQTPVGTQIPLGFNVRCSAWVKVTAGRGFSISGRAYSNTTYEAEGLGNQNYIGTGAWQYVETTIWTRATSANGVHFRPGLQVTTSGAVGTQLWVDDVAIYAETDAPWIAAKPRFVGTVTDLDDSPDALTVLGPGILQITATGPKARLGRIRVGDVPWPAETDGTRAARILALAATAAGVTVGTVDPGTVTVLGRDVDTQPALGLLDELASECGGLLVSRRDGALEYHDAAHRRNVAPLLALTAANVRSGVRWRQQLGGMVNDATVAYGPDPQATVRVTDPQSVTAYGPLAASVASQLSTLTDAQARAADMVGRRSRPRWRLDALTLDALRSITTAQMAALAQMEVGALLTVTGFPSAGPYVAARLYVEGWTEDWTAGDGWVLDLAVTEYGLTGTAPRWADVPLTTTWATAPADLTWLAAVGWYAGDAPAGRWLDVSAGDQWTEIALSRTWATEP